MSLITSHAPSSVVFPPHRTGLSDEGPDVGEADLQEGSRPGTRGGPWPAGPLDAAQRAFDVLVCPPAPLAFDCRGLAGLPPRILALDELARLLIDRST